MSPDQRRRFVGGRRAHNHRRRIERDYRRCRLAEVLKTVDEFSYGARKRLASELGISRWTLRKDLIALGVITRTERRERTERDAVQREAFANRLHESLRRGREIQEAQEQAK
ncbi:hypothetical protein CEE69_12215 [Rhodopirellula bahusiensis]|uniref:HTH deoR-type domain-containing protein n=2 Tax=Rhodopirellula bahusiensis TaxID=2014065 RepID=A0A2G1W829_9BACT|nr:hypothetical protein CEE69_12215 [Rhodopirellula bahusiensis]